MIEAERFVRNAPAAIATDESGVCLGASVETARWDFHFEGRGLVDFVHRVIVGLVRGGATPADDALFSPENPRGHAHFGNDTPEEIADGLVAAWVSAGMPELEWGDWRFNTAENLAHLDEVAEEMRRDARTKESRRPLGRGTSAPTAVEIVTRPR